MGTLVCGNCCCCRLCSPVSEEPLPPVAADFRPQDYVFRNGAECPMDVTVVFIDQNEYQQLYLQNLRRQRQQRRAALSPSAPSSPGPPPYSEVV